MNINDLLAKEEVILLDGAFGTYIELLGFTGKIPEIANLENPALVEKIHSDYAEAGAKVILSNTFSSNRIRFSRYGLQDKTNEIIEHAVGICRKVKEKYPGVFIAGDMGPAGELLEPYGSLSAEDAGSAFAEQAKRLEEAGVDFLLLETFSDLEELKVAYSFVKDVVSLDVIVSLSFSAGKEFRTIMGQRPVDFVQWAEKEGIEVIGTNCGINSIQMNQLTAIMRKFTNKVLWVKPNAGTPSVSSGEITYPESVEEFGKNCLEMIGHGVSFVGGCCGSTPEYIRFLHKSITSD